MCSYLNHMYLHVTHTYKTSNILKNKKSLKSCCIIFLVTLMHSDIINGKNHLPLEKLAQKAEKKITFSLPQCLRLFITF